MSDPTTKQGVRDLDKMLGKPRREGRRNSQPRACRHQWEYAGLVYGIYPQYRCKRCGKFDSD